MVKPIKNLTLLSQILPPSVDARGLPRVPGMYHWHDAGWNPLAVVKVYKKRGGRFLYVVPPSRLGIPVRISHKIAGRFVPAATQGESDV